MRLAFCLYLRLSGDDGYFICGKSILRFEPGIHFLSERDGGSFRADSVYDASRRVFWLRFLVGHKVALLNAIGKVWDMSMFLGKAFQFMLDDGFRGISR